MTTLMSRRLGGALLAAPLLGLLLLPASALAEGFLVTNLNDSGAGSLREAILEANVNEEADTITFDETLAGGTIVLSTGELTIADDMADPDLTIDGDLDDDGVPDITVNANGSSRVFFIASGAEANLHGLVITGGSVGPFGDGGGIENDGGTVTITSSTISGNSAEFGGGIFNSSGTVTVANSTISGNTASSRGGGIASQGSATLSVASSTISGNTALSSGGIENGDGTLTVENSTISGNTAQIVGGGILSAGGMLTVEYSTISGNSALGPSGAGGGIRNQGGTLEIKGTIVAGNTLQDCVNAGGSIASQGFNLDGDGTCGLDQTTDLPSTDPMLVLGPLMPNGGPTETHALLDADTNPAIDHIAPTDCTDIDDVPVLTDQRGVARPQPFPDGDCDIGAFELVQEAPVTIADLIELFDDTVADGTLVGAGPGNSAAGRRNALRNMLLAAGELLAQGDVDGACAQLQDAADRTDGAFPPPDFVQGPAAPDLHDAITEVQDELGCFV